MLTSKSRYNVLKFDLAYNLTSTKQRREQHYCIWIYTNTHIISHAILRRRQSSGWLVDAVCLAPRRFGGAAPSGGPSFRCRPPRQRAGAASSSSRPMPLPRDRHGAPTGARRRSAGPALYRGQHRPD